jgi:hypothetical protein
LWNLFFPGISSGFIIPLGEDGYSQSNSVETNREDESSLLQNNNNNNHLIKEVEVEVEVDVEADAELLK